MARKQPPLDVDVFIDRYRNEVSSRKLVELLVASLLSHDRELSFQGLTTSCIWSTIPYRPQCEGPREAFLRGMSPAHRQLLIAVMRRCPLRRALGVLKIRAMLGDRVYVAGVMKQLERRKGRNRLFAISVLSELQSPASTAALQRLAVRSRLKELRFYAIEGLVRRGDFSRIADLEAELTTWTAPRFVRRGNLAAALLFAGSQLGAETAAAILAAESRDDYDDLERCWRTRFRRGIIVQDWKGDLRQHVEQVLAER